MTPEVEQALALLRARAVGRGVLGAVETVAAALADADARVGRVVALCEDKRAESVDGGRADVDTLWPSDVLAALADAERRATEAEAEAVPTLRRKIAALETALAREHARTAAPGQALTAVDDLLSALTATRARLTNLRDALAPAAEPTPTGPRTVAEAEEI
ncbi:MAG TPA: hypothetical protein VNN79_09060 [Actinomycetota bacterium]|nr:hypothetical protein [Actinomycetota bacterium]